MPTPVVSPPTVPAHAVAVPLELRLTVAMGAGLLATLVMTGAMSVLSEGYVPPYVAASALFAVPPGRVSRRQADAVHYAAGLLAGLLFELLVLGIEGVREAAAVPPLVLWNVLTLSDLLAAVLVIGFLYVFFAYLVFPRYGDRLHEDATSRERVRLHWLVSANVYGVALLGVVVLLYAMLGLSAIP